MPHFFNLLDYKKSKKRFTNHLQWTIPEIIIGCNEVKGSSDIGILIIYDNPKKKYGIKESVEEYEFKTNKKIDPEDIFHIEDFSLEIDDIEQDNDNPLFNKLIDIDLLTHMLDDIVDSPNDYTKQDDDENISIGEIFIHFTCNDSIDDILSDGLREHEVKILDRESNSGGGKKKYYRRKTNRRKTNRRKTNRRKTNRKKTNRRIKRKI